jgi:branched-chain amino acid transport system substrate-binding protein
MNGTLEGIDNMLTYVAQAHPEIKTITVALTEDTVAGIQPSFFKMAKERRISVLGDIVGYAPDTIDYTPVVKKLIARNPDAICLINGWPSVMGSLLKIARQSGFQKLIFMTNYQPPEDMVSVAGKEVSSLFLQHGLLWDDPKNQPVVREIQEMIQSKYKHKNIYYTSLGFDNLWMLLQAIEAAQSLDPTVVKEKWEKMDFNMKSVWGKASIGGLKTYGIKHTMTHPIPVIGLTNGEAKTLKWLEVKAP